MRAVPVARWAGAEGGPHEVGAGARRRAVSSLTTLVNILINKFKISHYKGVRSPKAIPDE